MIPEFRNLPAIAVSVIVHVGIFLVLMLIPMVIDEAQLEYALETIFSEERVQEEFTEELDEATEIATSLNITHGGTVSTALGAPSTAAVQKVEITKSEALQDPKLQANIGDVTVPGDDMLGQDLGEGEVKGEVGAVVDGYGTALDRLTQELVRMMRADRLSVVWLFDESESMKDDQQELKDRLFRVYEELKLVGDDGKEKTEPKKRRGAGSVNRSQADKILLTSIVSFGDQYHVQTAKPTSEPAVVMKAIDAIPIDKTGNENTCTALIRAMDQFGAVVRGGRKLVLIVVSDESGDDGVRVEEVREKAQRLRAPIYVLGRESVFGSLYAHVRWRHPDTNRLHYLPIRRGPETPYAELLQHNGFRRRRDGHMSGFGPYEQVRLARDTGGIFFQLPHEQQDLNDFQEREYRMLDMRPYLPSLDSRREYSERRGTSEFRTALWDVISLLNPYDEKNTNVEIPESEYFSLDPADSSTRSTARLQQIVAMLSVMANAQSYLERVAPLRKREPSVRWRANFDLMTAQLFAYRVRLFQYAIALDQFSKTFPQRIKNPKSTHWSIRTGARQLIMPDEQQTRSLKISADDIQQAHQAALDGFARVRQDHPNTPWSDRATWEENRNFGAAFAEHYFPPPPPDRPKQPAPSPPPKL